MALREAFHQWLDPTDFDDTGSQYRRRRRLRDLIASVLDRCGRSAGMGSG